MTLETLLFENFTEPLVILRLDGTIERINPQFEIVFGWQRSALVGTSLYQFVAEKLQDGLRMFLEAAPASSTDVSHYSIEFRSAFKYDYEVTLTAQRIGFKDQDALLLRFRNIDLTDSRLHPIEHYHLDPRRIEDALRSNTATSDLLGDFNESIDTLIDHLDALLPYDVLDVMFVNNDRAYLVHSRGHITPERQKFLTHLSMPIEHFPALKTMKETQRPLLVQSNDTSMVPDNSFASLFNKVRSYVGAPLYFDRQLIGFIHLNSYTPDRYNTSHISLLELFTNYIAITIGQAQVNIQNRTQLTEMEIYLRNIMTMYELGNTLTSTFNLDEIYASLYDEVISKIMDFGDVRVILTDDQSSTLREDFVVLDGVIQPKVALAESTASTEEVYRQLMDEAMPQWNDNYFYIPMQTSKRIVGMIRVGPLTENELEQIDLLPLMIAVNMAAIAIENAHLYLTVQKQHGEISHLYHATTVLFETQSLDELTQQVVDTIIYGFGHQDCSLLLVDESRQALKNVAHNSTVSFKKNKSLPLNGPGLTTLCLRTGQTQYVPDVRQHPDYLEGDPRVHSELAIPLQTARHIFGVLDIQSDRLDGISDDEQHILLAFAGRVSAVIDNLLLTEELRRYVNSLEEIVDQRTRELKDALVAERKLSETKSRFVMTVSHQFRTPLTIIQSSKELLERYGDRMPPEQRQQRFSAIDQSVRDIVGILDDTITFNTLAEGRVSFNPTTLDLNEFTRSLVEDFRVKTPPTHEIIYASDAKEAVTIVDIEMWRKAVNELLTNARKFSEPQTQIRCSFHTGASYLVFEVQDQGLGIPEDDHDRIFGIYDRAANVDNIPGAGLGLAIVKQLIDRHSGKIELMSELGTGTTIRLMLPKYIGHSVEQSSR